MDFLTMLFLLVASHALCDYPLQGPFLSEAKNPNTALGKVFWPHALFAHSMIHGGAVLLLTGSVALALIEVVIHGATDLAKCNGRISLNTDQAIHILCKIIWAAVATLSF
jgi:hypothetical protein